MLSSVALFHRSAASGVVSHYNALPVIDIYGSVQGTDLGFRVGAGEQCHRSVQARSAT